MLLMFLSLLPVYADSWSKLGCYSSISVAESKGSYMYQSSGYCEQQCAGYRVAALKMVTNVIVVMLILLLKVMDVISNVQVGPWTLVKFCLHGVH